MNVLTNVLKMGRKSVWSFLLVVLTITFHSSSHFDISGDIQEKALKNLVLHDPIEIICDQNFTDYGFPGVGTKSNPFIISGLKITSTNADSNNIKISQTTKYFVIEKCDLSIDTPPVYSNFWSYQVSLAIRNCKIETVKIRENKCEGIYVYNSSKSLVENNEIVNSHSNGLLLRDSPFSVIEGNKIHKNVAGIHVEYSPYCNYSRNEIVNNNGYFELHAGLDDLYVPSGIILEANCSNSIIRNNYFENNRNTVCVWEGNNYTISSNVVIDSEEFSFYISRMDDSIFQEWMIHLFIIIP
jgi:parallel beta-helix repeat protein